MSCLRVVNSIGEIVLTQSFQSCKKEKKKKGKKGRGCAGAVIRVSVIIGLPKVCHRAVTWLSVKLKQPGDDRKMCSDKVDNFGTIFDNFVFSMYQDLMYHNPS